MFVFGQKWLYWAKRLYSGKVLVFGQSGCNPTKGFCIRSKMVVFGQKWLYSDNLVVFGQSGCIRAKMVVFEQKC